jgi:CHAT domain-containing protein
MLLPIIALMALMQAPRDPGIQPLESNRKVVRRVQGSDTLRFSIGLSKGQYLQGVVEQDGIDVVVRLLSPEHKLLLEVDGPNDNRGPEPVYWIANEDGSYFLEIAGARKTDPPGRIRLNFKRPRASKEGDTDRVEASLAYQAGNALLAKGDRASVEQALEKFRDSERRFGNGHAPYGAACARYKIAMALAGQGKRREAIAELERAANELARLKERSTEAFMWQKTGDQHLALGEPEEAAVDYRRSMSLIRRPSNPRREGNLQASIGASLFQASRYPEAEAAFERALPLHRQAGDLQNEAVSLASLGAVYRAQSRYDAAEVAYARALEIQREVKSPFGQAQVLNNLGFLNFMFGAYERSVNFYRQALEIATANKLPVLVGQIDANLGVIYQALEQPEEALGWQQRALEVARERNQIPLQSVSLAALGAALSRMGRTEEAGAALQQAIRLAESAKDRSAEGVARSQLALLEAGRGNFAAAQREVESAVALRRAAGDIRGEAQSLCHAGRIRLQEGNPDAALAPLRDCLVKSRQVRDRRTEAAALEGLMIGWAAQAKTEAAIFAGKQAVNRLQEIRGEVQTLGGNIQQQFAQGNEAVYRKLADLLVQSGRLAEAQQVLGLLKQAEYFQLLRWDPREAGSVNGRASMRSEEEALDAEYANLGGDAIRLGARRGTLLARISRTAQDDSDIAAVEKRLEAANQAMQEYLDRLSSRSVERDVSVRVEQLRESQALMQNLGSLPDGTVAIFTLVMPNRVNLILMTAQAQKAYVRPIPETELNRLIANWRQKLNRVSEDPRPLGKKLFDLLMPPDLVRDLQASSARTLMWSLDGALRYVPVAALYDGNRYLLESYNVTLFTLGSYAHIQDRPMPQWRVSGLGVSQAHDNFPALPGVIEELRAVVRVVGAEGGALPGEVKLDGAFTRDALRDLRRQWPVVHVASHFNFLPGSGAGSYLLLGDGSHLTMSELRASNNLFGGVDVLTLSACNTGMSDARADGKEVESFSVLAQRQGAKSVIASLWPVADASTAVLMKNFYRMRQEHPDLPKIEALRRAQIELLRGTAGSATQERGLIHQDADNGGRGDWSHPFYWAPFVLIGNWL